MTKAELLAALQGFPDSTLILVDHSESGDLGAASVRATWASATPYGGDCMGRHVEHVEGRGGVWVPAIVIREVRV